MGSWAGTCAVSRLAINPGEEVFYIFTKGKHVRTTYDLMGEISSVLKRRADAEKWKDNPEMSAIFTYDRADYESGFGEYDDYGGVEGVEIPDEHRDRIVLVRKNVADAMVEEGKKRMKREWRTESDKYQDSYIYSLVLFAWLTRIQLFGHILLGRQYPDMEEMEEQRIMYNILRKEMHAVYAQELADKKEYEDWSENIQKGEN